MSCSDILLSFLADVGEDWNDSFIFPTDGSTIDVTDYLNKSDYVLDTEIVEASCYVPPAATSFVESSSEDQDFQEALDMFGELASDEQYFPFPCDTQKPTSIAEALAAAALPAKKRKSDERISSSKKIKLVADEKINSVCALLQKYKVQREIEGTAALANEPRRFKFPNPVGTAQAYLQAIFGAAPATPVDLLKLSSPSASFQCKPLASLHSQVQSRKSQMKLSAWCPVNQSVCVFPEVHTGVGQVAAASRGFHAAVSDMVSTPLLQSLKFTVEIVKEDAITSKFNEQLSAPFVWRSVGMVAMGYPEELEFTGLIRCTFVKEGVSVANVSFDACKLVRQSQTLFTPMPVANSAL